MRVDQNGIGETFWTISSPAEFGNIEFTLRASKSGLQIGVNTISWRALDEARTSAFHGPLPLTIAETRTQAMRCSCHGSDDYCPCQNVPDTDTQRQRTGTIQPNT